MEAGKKEVSQDHAVCENPQDFRPDSLPGPCCLFIPRAKAQTNKQHPHSQRFPTGGDWQSGKILLMSDGLSRFPEGQRLPGVGPWGREAGNASDGHENHEIPRLRLLPLDAAFPCGKKAVTWSRASDWAAASGNCPHSTRCRHRRRRTGCIVLSGLRSIVVRGFRGGGRGTSIPPTPGGTPGWSPEHPPRPGVGGGLCFW